MRKYRFRFLSFKLIAAGFVVFPAEESQHVDAKALSNCIGYLVKSGRLLRVGRGHYVVAGAGLVTADPIEQHDIEHGSENEN